MFSKSSKGTGASAAPPKRAVPSILSMDLHVVGDLTSDGEIHIDGRVDGDIRSKTLLIGETAVITGEIVAVSVTIHGTINGQIKARSVTLAKTAHVNGDIVHENLAIEFGAFLEGHCRRMDDKKEAAEGRINLVVREAGHVKGGAEPKKIAAGI